MAVGISADSDDCVNTDGDAAGGAERGAVGGAFTNVVAGCAVTDGDSVVEAGVSMVVSFMMAVLVTTDADTAGVGAFDSAVGTNSEVTVGSCANSVVAT